MATAQQQRTIFDMQEAQRFAALWAGFDIGNTSEAEAMGKGRVVRRMVAEKNLRLIDALELSEIKAALDDQMKPVRLPVPDVMALEEENKDLRGKLAIAVPKVTELAQKLRGLGRALSVVMLIALIEAGITVLLLFALANSHPAPTQKPKPDVVFMPCPASSVPPQPRRKPQKEESPAKRKPAVLEGIFRDSFKQ